MQPDLSQLRDIHLPDPVSWWPLAPGWWGLLALLLVFSGISFWFYRRYQANRWRAHALAECQRIKKLLSAETAEVQAQQEAAQQVSVLLRRVALSRFPRKEVASLSGQDWIDFLVQSANHNTELTTESAHTLLFAPYQLQHKNNIAPLLNFAEHWIKALPDQHHRGVRS